MPTSLWHVAFANLALVVLIALIWRTKGLWTASILAVTYVYAVYTYVLAPDLPAYQGLHSFAIMYSFNFKTQREIIINGILMISIFILLGHYLNQWRHSKYLFLKKYRKYIVLILCFILLAAAYQPIDTRSAGVSTAPIDSFRSDLNNNLPTCVPLSPTPVFYTGTNWVYAHKATCHTPNHDTNLFKPDFNTMNLPATHVNYNINAVYFRLAETDLTAIVIPVVNTSGRSTKLMINDNNGTTISSKVEAKKDIQFITFNTRGLARDSTYNITINQESTGLNLGRFNDSDDPIVYTYFLEK
jgi:hypothetical protein